MQTKFLSVLSAAVFAITQPAFAFGPAAMGRDLIHATSISRSAGAEVVRAGFVRPNLPQALVGDKEFGPRERSSAIYYHPLTLTIGLVIGEVLAGTAKAIETGMASAVMR